MARTYRAVVLVGVVAALASCNGVSSDKPTKHGLVGNERYPWVMATENGAKTVLNLEDGGLVFGEKETSCDDSDLAKGRSLFTRELVAAYDASYDEDGGVDASHYITVYVVWPGSDGGETLLVLDTDAPSEQTGEVIDFLHTVRAKYAARN